MSTHPSIASRRLVLQAGAATLLATRVRLGTAADS
jgi:hypothetical protein